MLDLGYYRSGSAGSLNAWMLDAWSLKPPLCLCASVANPPFPSVPKNLLFEKTNPIPSSIYGVFKKSHPKTKPITNLFFSFLPACFPGFTELPRSFPISLT